MNVAADLAHVHDVDTGFLDTRRDDGSDFGQIRACLFAYEHPLIHAHIEAPNADRVYRSILTPVKLRSIDGCRR